MEFRKMSLAELREYAKEKGIRNISTLKKAELAELLENMDLSVVQTICQVIVISMYRRYRSGSSV